MKEIKINKKQETIYSFNAPTGLPVYMWPTTSKKNVHLSLVVKYGSTGTNFTCNNVKYSVPTGTAHYLEHLKFHLKNEDASNLLVDDEMTTFVRCNNYLTSKRDILSFKYILGRKFILDHGIKFDYYKFLFKKK